MNSTQPSPAGSPDPAAYLDQLTADERDHFGDIFQTAVQIVVATQRASTSTLQRRLRIGYCRASEILNAMERIKIVGPEIGFEPRTVLVH